MADEQWNKEIFKLPENHGWTAKPGNNVVILDRGALRFEIPQDWVAQPSTKSLKLVDGEPPNDDMSLEVSVIYVGMAGFGVNWDDLPLRELIKQVTSDTPTGFTAQRAGRNRKRDRNKDKSGPPMALKFGELEMAWIETEFTDPVEKRPAFSRMVITRHAKSSIHALLTLCFWPEDAERAKSVWNNVLGSIHMGEHYDSPFYGPDRKDTKS